MLIQSAFLLSGTREEKTQEGDVLGVLQSDPCFLPQCRTRSRTFHWSPAGNGVVEESNPHHVSAVQQKGQQKGFKKRRIFEFFQVSLNSRP